jgi:hypothetical protein
MITPITYPVLEFIPATWEVINKIVAFITLHFERYKITTGHIRELSGRLPVLQRNYKEYYFRRAFNSFSDRTEKEWTINQDKHFMPIFKSRKLKFAYIS